MGTTPLKNSLAEVARNSQQPSYADALAFIESIESELANAGAACWHDFGDRSALPFPKAANADALHSLYQRTETLFSDRLRVLTLTLATDITGLKKPEETFIGGGDYNFPAKGRVISMDILMPRTPQAGKDFLINCGFLELSGISNRGIHSYQPNHQSWYRSGGYDWAKRMKAVKEFAELVTLHGSPALSAALRPVETPVVNPLRSSLKL